MKTILPLLLSFVFQLSASAQNNGKVVHLQQKNKLKEQLSRFLDKDQVLLDFKTGDLNNDGKPDVILIGTTETDNEKNRKVYLLICVGKDSFKVTATNSNIIGCAVCGGAGAGDPYRKIVLSKGGFSFVQLYGASDKTETTIAFKYNPKRKSWFLSKNNMRSYSSRPEENPGNEIKVVQTESRKGDYGKLKFEDYR
ncbi:FG-GAP repeat protein [Pedobacter nutrimenti]|uniref:VCBS repeat protein n=1 Tax=Pedobacter nutrimenti TaxID=1241337 RepID=A0A318UIC9_9SPHI|nr:FG-GAP repeat protein [Pedobacter nutrimenti]PYF74798.1 hypothetical protein B0O44_103244 [Pedobacter nutrimenti]